VLKSQEGEVDDMTEIKLSKTANTIYASSFEAYKSNVCHMLKYKGDLDFLEMILVDDTITQFYENKLYRNCFYLLAMVDYISKENDISLCTKYNYIRNQKLKKLQVPKSIQIADELLENHKTFDKAYSKAIPEFLEYNIMEGDIRNVV
jgi:hypothetical protein